MAKKLLMLALASAFTLGLAACSQGSKDKNGDTNASSQSATPAATTPASTTNAQPATTGDHSGATDDHSGTADDQNSPATTTQ